MMEPLNVAETTCPRRASLATRLAAAALALILCAALGTAAWHLPAPQSTLPQLLRASLPESGVRNPVTAVLLNFRGYDTLLEIAVLLLAAVAARAIGGAPVGGIRPRPVDVFLSAFFRFLAPLMIVVAGYILWVGKHAPGGAFQAGAILAAAGILAVLITGIGSTAGSMRESLALGFGLFTFCAVGLGTLWGQPNFLQYPLAWAGELILLIESAAAVSIAVALVVLFIGCLRDDGAGDSAAEPVRPPHPPGAGE
jgi:multisubunit Na+/H+ antiporter MnhB subunit